MANKYWVGGSGTWDASSTANWSDTSGGAAGAVAPTSADAVFFDANSGTGTCTTASGATSASISFDSATLTLLFGVNHTLTGTFTLTQGSVDLNNTTLTCQIFSSSNSNTRSIAFGTGNITLTGNATTILAMTVANNFSYTGSGDFLSTYSGSTGRRTITFSGTSGGTEANSPNFYVTAGADELACNTAGTIDLTGFSGTFRLNTRTVYGNFVISSSTTLVAGASVTTFAKTTGTQNVTTAGKTIDFPIVVNGVGGTVEFQDALTQGSTRAFTITNGTVKLKDGVTSTVGAFATSGTNQKFLQSTLAGSQATLSQASGTVNASYLTIQDISATGGATWNALWSNNNVDAGDNTGWVFGDPPITLATEYTYALRSFTQPRRF